MFAVEVIKFYKELEFKDSLQGKVFLPLGFFWRHRE
jgi:hypothetical protein